MADKICVECKHCNVGIYQINWHGMIAKCMRPEETIAKKVNLVTGATERVYFDCYQERLRSINNTNCGEEGKFYEPKESV